MGEDHQKPSSLSPLKLAIPTVVIASLAGMCGWWLLRAHSDELGAKQKLAELGALVAMDADGRHVGTVTFSTIKGVSKTREALEIVSTLGQVKAIDLNRTAIDNSDLTSLAKCTSLVSLSLKSTAIDDSGLSALAGLRQLESLHLNDTAVSDAGLPHLAKLTNLKLLDLSGTQVASDLAPISELPQLEWLVLCRLTLEEDAVRTLGHAPALRRLTLRSTEVNDSAVEELQKTRPDLSLDE